jgi:hypothetical protein
MLKRTSGHAPSRSSTSGIGSEPATRSALTSWYVLEAIGPEPSVTRSSVRSWNAMSLPSEVALASVSR